LAVDTFAYKPSNALTSTLNILPFESSRPLPGSAGGEQLFIYLLF